MDKPHLPAVEPGAIVARYHIIGRLGAGGMGEVYKAHDTTLGRTVALKILPPQLVRNDERMRRFVQEARSASSLNHPNIVTIYEIGQAPLMKADGVEVPGAAPIHYIAMELIEGVTLKTRIHDQSASLRVLLGHVAQAAEGLAKAHAAGIVHRDLKPENIMVSADGFTKVLDFGVAKLTLAPDSDAHTRTMGARDDTRDGVILGTVAYMSPEQVQGKPADARSDIFALGTILYEAATRRRPFVADSDVEVMHKILHDKPEAVADLNPAVPAELRRTIRRCLAKEPERRFQSMKDVAIELSEIVEEFEQLSLASSLSASGSSSGAVAPIAAPMSAVTKGAIALAAVVAVAAVIFGGYQWRQSRATPASPVSFESMKILPITTSGRAIRVAISPDGKYVAHVERDRGQSSLWMRQVATGSDARILPAQDAPILTLTFSPNGDYLYYTSVDRSDANFTYSWLYMVPTIGGQARKVIYDVDTPPAFSPDGGQIAFGRGMPSRRENHVIVANADGTGERRLAAFQALGGAARLAWSHDGTKIVTPVAEMNPVWNIVLTEIDVTSGAARRIGTKRWVEFSDPSFLPDGSALLIAAADTESAGQQLWLQPYPDGTPVRVTNDLSAYDRLSLARDGSRIAAVRADSKTSMILTAVGDATPGTLLLPPGARGINDPSVASTGAIVYSVFAPNAADIVLLDGPGSAPRVLTRGGENFEPSISADGRTIVFSTASTSGPPHIFAMNADGSNLRQVTRGTGEMDPSLSPDGRTLAFARAHGAEIWVQPLDGGAEKRLSERAASDPRVSRDGKYVVFLEWQSAAGGAANLTVLPLAGGAPVLAMPWERGQDFRWHPDGKTITFRRLDGGVTNVFGLGIDGAPPAPITKFTSGTFIGYDWTADGRLVLLRNEVTSNIVLISDWLRAK